MSLGPCQCSPEGGRRQSGPLTLELVQAGCKTLFRPCCWQRNVSGAVEGLLPVPRLRGLQPSALRVLFVRGARSSCTV